MLKMNVPRHNWDDNLKQDLLYFLKTACEHKNSEYCDVDEYNRLSPFFPLKGDLQRDLQIYTDKAFAYIDITQSDDEEPPNNQVDKLDSLVSLQNDTDVAFNSDLAESIKYCLGTEKTVSQSLLNDFVNLDADSLEKIFRFLAQNLNTEEVKCFWSSLNGYGTEKSVVIQLYVSHLFLPKVKQEFSYDLQDVFQELSKKHLNVLKSGLIKELLQAQTEVSNVLLQYVALLDNGCKKLILSDFIAAIDHLHPNYIPVIEPLLNSQKGDTDNNLNRLVELMAGAATDFVDDNAYGKLLFKIVSCFDRNAPSALEQPLKYILGRYKGIWKIKVERIVAHWFNDTFTQSFI